MRTVIGTVADTQHPELQGVGDVQGLRGRSDSRADMHAGLPVDLLPTPDASADKYRLGGGASSHGAWKLEPDEASSLLPTPTTRDHKDHVIRREPHRPDAVDTLSRALTEVTEP